MCGISYCIMEHLSVYMYIHIDYYRWIVNGRKTFLLFILQDTVYHRIIEQASIYIISVYIYNAWIWWTYMMVKILRCVLCYSAVGGGGGGGSILIVTCGIYQPAVCHQCGLVQNFIVIGVRNDWIIMTSEYTVTKSVIKWDLLFALCIHVWGVRTSTFGRSFGNYNA